jgi:hypothetical protein
LGKAQLTRGGQWEVDLGWGLRGVDMCGQRRSGFFDSFRLSISREL